MPRETLGDFEHQVLLGILRLGGETYSVPLVEELEERTGRAIAQAAVFIVLRRLEDKGLLTSRERPAPGGARVRRYFKPTRLAFTRLRETRRTLMRLWEGLEEPLEES